MKRILFISHEATRTGAPLVLLNILQNLKKTNKYLFDVLLINGGDLQNDFMRTSDKTFIFNKKGTILLFINLLTRISNSRNSHILFAKLSISILRLFQTCQYFLISKKLKKRNYSLLYSNSVCSLSLTSKVKKYLPIPVILHIHELEYSIDTLVGHEYFFNHITLIDHFIAVSDSVKEELMHNYKIDETKVSIAYPSSPNLIAPNKKRTDILEELNIDEKSFVIGASGTGIWIKGYDLFINLAYCFFKKYPESFCVFLWIGKIFDSDYRNIRYDLNKAGLIEKVKFIGEKPNPVDYYNIFDIFTLVSRIESFSLVCLENAFLSKPLICFDNIGYIPKFIKDDAGFVIPYMDIEYMASRIHLLYTDRDLRKRMGNKARDKYFEKFNFELSLKQITNCIDNFMTQ